MLHPFLHFFYFGRHHFLHWCLFLLLDFYGGQDDWQKEKHDFLQSLSRISSLPRSKVADTGAGGSYVARVTSGASSPQLSSGPSGMEIVSVANKPIMEKKASVYGEVVKSLNSAREHGLSFKVMNLSSLILML